MESDRNAAGVLEGPEDFFTLGPFFQIAGKLGPAAVQIIGHRQNIGFPALDETEKHVSHGHGVPGMEAEDIAGIRLDGEDGPALGDGFLIGVVALFQTIFTVGGMIRRQPVFSGEPRKGNAVVAFLQQFLRLELQTCFLRGSRRLSTAVVTEKSHGPDLQRSLIFEGIEPKFPDAGGVFPEFERNDIGRGQRDFLPVPVPVADITAQIDISTGQFFVLIPEKIDLPPIAGPELFGNPVFHDKKVVIARFQREVVELETRIVFS